MILHLFIMVTVTPRLRMLLINAFLSNSAENLYISYINIFSVLTVYIYRKTGSILNSNDFITAYNCSTDSPISKKSVKMELIQKEYYKTISQKYLIEIIYSNEY